MLINTVVALSLFSLTGCSLAAEATTGQPTHRHLQACFVSPHPVARLQSPEGHWESNVATTSLILLALAQEGNTPAAGPERKHFNRGLQWLRNGQAPDGSFSANWEGSAWATLAISVAYYDSKSKHLRSALDRGLQYLIKTCQDEKAGELLLILASAREAGLDINEALIIRLLATEERPNDLAHTALRQLGFMLFGRGQITQESARSLIDRGAQLNYPQNARELFFVTMALRQAGGDAWTEWCRVLMPLYGESERNPGDLRARALVDLTLAIYYRYPRIVGSDGADS